MTGVAADDRPAGPIPDAAGRPPGFPSAGGDAKTPAWVFHGEVVGGLLILSVVMWWHVWVTGHPTSTASCQCGDPAQYIWFNAWVPWAIGHLHNPFLSHAIYAGQGGVNNLELSTMLPSLIVAPITVLFGPVASFNVLVTLIPVANPGASSTACPRSRRSSPPGSALWSTWP